LVPIGRAANGLRLAQSVRELTLQKAENHMPVSKSDKAEGKVQNAIGGVKDAVRDALKK
jgi:hypothetical protein